MQIAIVGTGYVGLVTGACLADFGHRVVCVDTDPVRVSTLCRGEMPFYEPELGDLVHRNAAAGRLEFTSDIEAAVRQSLVVFLAVGTPEGPGGDADLSQVMAAVDAIAPYLDEYRVIVTKSTVPVGTGRLIHERLQQRVLVRAAFDVVSNPEFLRQGSAVNEFMRPDRIVIGANSPHAVAIMKEVYRPLYLIETPILVTDVETAEMIKCAANALLAVRISFMNEVANLCDRVGADVHAVAKGLGLDKRIGGKFLHPGPGYGGSCFPKDTRALAALGARFGARQQIVESTIEVNERQRCLTVEKVLRAIEGAAEPRVAVLGLAFKPNTSDVREAPAVYLCRELVGAGVSIRVFDPVAMPDAQRALADCGDRIEYAVSAYAACEGAAAVVIMTEWNEFRALDFERLRYAVARPVIVDTRNVLDPQAVLRAGFAYFSTGRDAVARRLETASVGRVGAHASDLSLLGSGSGS